MAKSNLPDDLFACGDFPNLHSAQRARKTSECDRSYNCAAYVLGITDANMWPGSSPYVWPDPYADDSVGSLLAHFRFLGYEVCADSRFESGVEKIAIFVKDGEPTHVAIQRSDGDGVWASKLGRNVDIEHDLRDLEDGPYGQASVFVRRKAGEITSQSLARPEST